MKPSETMNTQTGMDLAHIARFLATVVMYVAVHHDYQQSSIMAHQMWGAAAPSGFGQAGQAPEPTPVPDDDTLIRELLGRTRVTLGLTNTGQVGVWIGESPDFTAPAEARAATAHEALLEAAELF